jgi:hypothetical protein
MDDRRFRRKADIVQQLARDGSVANDPTATWAGHSTTYV